jgi:hypothetical protein
VYYQIILNYNLQAILDDIKGQRIPVDFMGIFDDAGVPFYEGASRSSL